MKIVIDEDLKGKDLINFLIENKQALIKQKKSFIKHTDTLSVNPSLFDVKAEGVNKTTIGNISPDATTVRVRTVANACMWCDSDDDVLLTDSASKTIKERKGMIPHLHDHMHELNAQVGDVLGIALEDITLRELGVKKDGSVQCIVFDTDIKKSYNEGIFEKYKTGKIKQHSIGLRYMKIDLAVNDDRYEQEYKTWQQHIKSIVNRKWVEERGFFWAVSEIQLLENSCVLFGSNELTPTLDVKALEEDNPATSSYTVEPHVNTFDVMSAIKSTTFIN